MLTLRRWLSITTLLMVTSIAIVFIAMLFGSEVLRPLDTLNSLISFIRGHSGSETGLTILFNLRLPRILLALVVGGSLAVTGGIFQTILKNPLADPYLLGISGGAALGVIISLFSNININIYGFTSTTFMAFTGALLTLFIVYRLSRVNNKISPQTMLMMGVMVNAVIFAIIMFFTSVVNSNQMFRVFFWLLGYLSSPDYVSLTVISLLSLAGMVIILYHARLLNVLTLDDDTAQSLGINLESVRRRIFIAGALLITAGVSVCGPIGFIGIMVPHAVRLLIGIDYRLLIPVSFVGGGILLIAADAVARSIISPAEIPVGIITSLAGAPFFIYLMRKKRLV
ncbi:MAG: iron ABC transporter permease [Nitrospirae bacterium]|nr:iron ABC transporter permease [Nitrospirota bacterium]